MTRLLVTGGTGSLGSAIVIESLKSDFHSIWIYSRNEYEQWKMRHDSRFQDKRLHFLIGDIRDKDRLYQIMPGINYVIHAAALKHVTACQQNPMEAFKTNIFGTMNIIDAAVSCGVEKLLAISSDKAVAPTNVYGATKLSLEHLIKNANVYGKTKFSILRSGNFFESRGNVFELWEQQVKEGELTLTSNDMKRYFIPIEKVAQLALQLLAIMHGQEVFVPKMIEYSMIELLKEKYPNVRMKITGKAEGEKDREELFTEDEENRAIEYDDYWTILQ